MSDETNEMTGNTNEFQQSPDRPVWVKHLSGEDGEILDALLAAMNQDPHAGTAQGRDETRTQRMRTLLTLLDTLSEHEDDPALVQRTLDAVRAAQTRERFLTQQIEMRGSGAGGNLRQFGAIAVMLVLGVSLLLPVLDRNRAEAERVACAANLNTAHAALMGYADNHNGTLPRRKVEPGTSWWQVGRQPDREDGVFHSNSAHLYLLVEQNLLDADALACPSNPHAPVES